VRRKEIEFEIEYQLYELDPKPKDLAMSKLLGWTRVCCNKLGWLVVC